MNKGLYSIYDSVSKEFAGPWLDNTDAAAARRFRAWISSSSKQDGFVSTDYSLYMVGEFNVTSGEIIPVFKEVAINEGENE